MLPTSDTITNTCEHRKLEHVESSPKPESNWKCADLRTRVLWVFDLYAQHQQHVSWWHQSDIAMPSMERWICVSHNAVGCLSRHTIPVHCRERRYSIPIQCTLHAILLSVLCEMHNLLIGRCYMPHWFLIDTQHIIVWSTLMRFRDDTLNNVHVFARTMHMRCRILWHVGVHPIKSPSIHEAIWYFRPLMDDRC